LWRELFSRLRRPLRALAISAFLGLALGYSVFYFVFPNVSVPAAAEASLPLIVGILATAAIVAGLVTEDLPADVVQGFVSIPIGVLIAFVLAISPSATGFLEVRADEILAFVVRLGFPLYLLAVPLNTVFGLVGLLIRERFGLRSSAFLRPSTGGHRK